MTSAWLEVVRGATAPVCDRYQLFARGLSPSSYNGCPAAVRLNISMLGESSEHKMTTRSREPSESYPLTKHDLTSSSRHRR